MSLIVAIMPLALFSTLAFYKPSALLFMLIAGGSLMLGLSWFDTYTTNLGLTIGLMMIGYCFVCFGFAFRCIFWPSGERSSEE